MNLTADPAIVAAEVAYRFETGRIHHAPAGHDTGRHGVGTWLRRATHGHLARRRSRSQPV